MNKHCKKRLVFAETKGKIKKKKNKKKYEGKEKQARKWNESTKGPIPRKNKKEANSDEVGISSASSLKVRLDECRHLSMKLIKKKDPAHEIRYVSKISELVL